MHGTLRRHPVTSVPSPSVRPSPQRAATLDSLFVSPQGVHDVMAAPLQTPLCLLLEGWNSNGTDQALGGIVGQLHAIESVRLGSGNHGSWDPAGCCHQSFDARHVQ